MRLKVKITMQEQYWLLTTRLHIPNLYSIFFFFSLCFCLTLSNSIPHLYLTRHWLGYHGSWCFTIFFFNFIFAFVFISFFFFSLMALHILVLCLLSIEGLIQMPYIVSFRLLFLFFIKSPFFRILKFVTVHICYNKKWSFSIGKAKSISQFFFLFVCSRMVLLGTPCIW